MDNELHIDDYSGQGIQKNNPKSMKKILREGGLLFIYGLTLSIPIFLLCGETNIVSGESWVCYGQGLGAMILMGVMMPVLFGVILLYVIVPSVIFGFLIYKTKEKINHRGVKICLILCLHILFYFLVSIIGTRMWFAAMSV